MRMKVILMVSYFIQVVKMNLQAKDVHFSEQGIFIVIK
jgi:hypothetical protein